MKYLILIIGVVVLAALCTMLGERPTSPPATISLDQRIRTSSFLIRNSSFGGTAINLRPGIALTARHVCQDFVEAPEDRAVAIDFAGGRHKVTNIEIDKTALSDLCVVKYDNPNSLIPDNAIAPASETTIGTVVVTGGFGGGKEYSCHSGLVSSNRLIADENKIVSEVFTFPADVIGGASGSGVFSTKGEIIGILSCASKELGAGAVPLPYIRKFLTRLGLL